MERKIALILVIVLVFSLSLFGCGNGESGSGLENENHDGEKTYTFKFAYPQAEASYYGKTYGYLCERITEETGGTIQFEMYPSDSLMTQTETLEAMMLGNLEMCHFYTTFQSSTIKDFLPFEIPGAYTADRYEELSDVTFDIVDSILEDYGIKLVSVAYPDSVGIASAKGLINTKEDLVNQIIRVPGAYTAKAFEKWGGNASTIDIGDVSTAIDRGTVDGVYTGWMMLPAFKFHEIAPYITITPFQNSYYGIMMNRDIWDSLSDNQKAGIERAAAQFMEYSSEMYKTQWDNFVKAIEEIGGEYTYMPEELSEELAAISREMFEEIKPMMTDKGIELYEALQLLW